MSKASRVRVAVIVSLVASWMACSSGPGRDSKGVTPETHVSFPIVGSSVHAIGRTTLDGVISCDSCHPPEKSTFTEFSCTGCHVHQQEVTDRLHASVGRYRWESPACYQCHSKGEKVPFDHAGISGGCASCHDAGHAFAALPVEGFTHPSMGGSDCSGCHDTKDWKGTRTAPSPSSDPAHDVTVTGLLPTWADSEIVDLTPLQQTLSMTMNHASSAIPAAANSACGNCHPDAATGSYFPGNLHSTLAQLGLPQPGACRDCHDVAPRGFLGPLATTPARSPPSGEMRHDAVLWAAGQPTSSPAVSADCGFCHAPPSPQGIATWATGRSGPGSSARFHSALAEAGQAQPASCIDCHANGRPMGGLTPSNASLDPGISFDHGSPEAQGDCASCHQRSAQAQFADWSGGSFHAAGSTTPPSCLPCHAGERPTSTAGWSSPGYTRSPFDFVTNAKGITHGAGQDCAVCHAGPGTGAWGGSQNWRGGHFDHGAGALSASTCIACHSTQRPDLQSGATAAAMASLLGFDHSTNGTGDCVGCHQATVNANRFVDYVNPSTGMLPGGDWQGGTSYPGSSFASSQDQFITVSQLNLIRSGPNNLVTSTSTVSTTLYNGMVHTSAAIPAAVSPGPANNPDTTTCWHCHTNTNGVVTSFANGRFHDALAAYSATPGGTVTPLPQPVDHCEDCHGPMRPPGIVEQGGSNLQPMDHSALFTQPVTLNGKTVSSVADMDCSACHADPGGAWSNATFHNNIGNGSGADCSVCHFPLMADATRADVTLATDFVMKHRAPQLTTQNCKTCHVGALAKAKTRPLAATLFQGGTFHASVPAQPGSCNECHLVSKPSAATQSTVTYSLTQGGTTTNLAQWMRHDAAPVAGKDCAQCHAADATASPTAFSRSTQFHANVSAATPCKVCHGTANGNGTTPGSGNNLPSGKVDSSTVTTASLNSATGVPAGTHDQLDHADLNVSSFDCGVCHTQVGPSTASGIAGKEWAQAKFHTHFDANTPLVMNSTTGRCSTCHLNVKPGPGYAGQDHSSFTAAAGTQDCSSCHAWPGTGTSSAPNWQGAAGGAPATIFVGGFLIPKPPAANTTTTQIGIGNLPHPSTNGVACSSCHAGGGGGKNAIGYDHASSLINSNCRSCHEAGSNLVGTAWNGATTQSSGAGDTRPFTLTSVVARYKGDSRTVTYANHFYPVDCYQCHVVPTGTATATTGSSYTSAWSFPHNKSKMTNPGTCVMCHTNGIPN